MCVQAPQAARADCAPRRTAATATSRVGLGSGVRWVTPLGVGVGGGGVSGGGGSRRRGGGGGGGGGAGRGGIGQGREEEGAHLWYI